MSATILWRRLDVPGHEAAELSMSEGGWQLSGVATLAESGRPCRLDYTIEVDAEWVTRQCSVRGYVGADPVRLDIVRSAGGEWSVNGVAQSQLRGCDDIDLAFSPSTNLLPIRRLRLDVGAIGAVRAAWLLFPELRVDVLEQSYRRLARDRYLFETATGFRRELTVDEAGLVLDYPELWIAEARGGDLLSAG